jgi:hypothetical protein
MNTLLHTLQEYAWSPVCMCWCLFKALLLGNELLQTWQTNGSTHYVTADAFSNDSYLYVTSYTHHSDMDVLHCLLLMTFQIALIAEWPNTYHRNTGAPQCVYNGASSGHPYQWMTSDKCETCRCSPLCNSLSFFKLPLALNELLHMSQAKGQSPLCISWCVFKALLLLNDLLHITNMRTFHTVTELMTLLCRSKRTRFTAIIEMRVLCIRSVLKLPRHLLVTK